MPDEGRFAGEYNPGSDETEEPEAKPEALPILHSSYFQRKKIIIIPFQAVDFIFLEEK